MNYNKASLHREDSRMNCNKTSLHRKNARLHRKDSRMHSNKTCLHRTDSGLNRDKTDKQRKNRDINSDPAEITCLVDDEKEQDAALSAQDRRNRWLFFAIVYVLTTLLGKHSKIKYICKRYLLLLQPIMSSLFVKGKYP